MYLFESVLILLITSSCRPLVATKRSPQPPCKAASRHHAESVHLVRKIFASCIELTVEGSNLKTNDGFFSPKDTVISLRGQDNWGCFKNLSIQCCARQAIRCCSKMTNSLFPRRIEPCSNGRLFDGATGRGLQSESLADISRKA